MLVSDFQYDLPDNLIARYPAYKRDESRLMLLSRGDNSISCRKFSDVVDYLNNGDLLVLNNTKVIPARITGIKESGGKVEIFLLRKVTDSDSRWLCMVKSSKRFRSGQSVRLSAGMTGVMLEKTSPETWLVDFTGDTPFDAWLDIEGHMPLPPYLQRNDETGDKERYQTVYAAVPGAVAAPTAGLHFTEQLLDNIAAKGVKIAYITLHTGLGTFLPIRVANIEDHKIHSEFYSISEESAEAISNAKDSGARVIAVGTTTARTLEYAASENGFVHASSGEADIFIYPGYRFKVVDALITNFHLPESTLLMLVSAFAGKEKTLSAYKEAIKEQFRFYSYGDAMMIT